MVSQRKRSMFLGLGLTVALVLAVGLLPAVASAASTLTGENLNGASASGNSNNCHTTGISTFTVDGTATGPYPGTFQESGSYGGVSLSATFTITSGTTTISGSKSGIVFGGSTDCRDPGSPGGDGSDAVAPHLPYTATIHTPNGNFHDEGTSAVNVSITGSAATLTESFTSSLAAPVLIGPTSKDQCKNDGWKNFPQFKNQGQCVSSMQSQT